MHPAVWLVAWMTLAVVLRGLPLTWLVGATALAAAFACFSAGVLCFRLLRRARWLFLVIGAVMLTTTPGEFLPGWLGRVGMTWEGAALAAEHTAYLLTMLCTLAIIHHRLGNEGVIAGLYRLAGPFPWRDRLAVRLMLVLAAVEEKEKRHWRDWLTPRAAPVTALAPLRLVVPPLSPIDVVALAALLLSLVGWSLAR